MFRTGRGQHLLLPIALLVSLGSAAGCATTGGLPDWVNAPYAHYPKERYVVAVGSGPDFETAKRQAMGSIAAFLGVEINSVSGVSESETVTRAGGQSTSSGSLRAEESVNQIISQKLSNVQVERVHSQGSTTYVLTVLDKPTFLAGLAVEADNTARTLGEGVKAAAADAAPAQTMLVSLRLTAVRLEALNARIIALGGAVSPDATTTLRNGLGYLARFDITITMPAPGVKQGPACDQGDPRLKQAIKDTGALVGHGVAFHFNLDQMPTGRSFCDDLFERFIGLIPKDIARMKERQPAIYGYGAPALKRIDFEYDGTAQYTRAEFDRGTGRFLIVMTSRGGYPIPSNTITSTFEEGYEAWVIGHFRGVEPDAVAPAEHALYFEYLTNKLWWGKGEPKASREEKEDLANDHKATVMLKVLRFAAIAGKRDAKLAAAVNKFLAEQNEYFGRAYKDKAGLVRKLPAGSPWKRAERAWVDWMNGAFEGFSDEAKTRLLPEMLGWTMAWNNDDGIVWIDVAYPGLKSYDMGLAIIDRWLKAGHPGHEGGRDGDDKQLALFAKVVSPIKRNSQGRRSVENFDRNNNWYFHAMRTDALKQRLLADILARKSEAFTETAFANLLSVNHTLHGNYKKEGRNEWGDFLFFWRGVEADEKQWKVATRVLAEYDLEGDTRRALYDEGVKLWRQYPKLRGSVLYMLAINARYDRDLVPWAEFGRVFGAPVSSREAADFLDMGTRAVSALPHIWQALGKGWSRADLLVPRLDRFIEDPMTRANDFQDPSHSLAEIIHKLRAENAGADLGRVHAYFQKRVAAHPSEEREFQTLLDLSGNRR